MSGGAFTRIPLRAALKVPSLRSDRAADEIERFRRHLAEYRASKPYPISTDPAYFRDKLPPEKHLQWTVDGEDVALDTRELIDTALQGKRLIRASDGGLYTWLRARALGLLPHVEAPAQQSTPHPAHRPGSSQSEQRGDRA